MKLWSHLSYSHKLGLAVMVVIISALVIDTSIIKVYYLNVQQQSPSNSGIIVFIIISSIYIVGQYFVSGYIKRKSREVGDYKKLHLQVLHKALALVQYVLTAINIIVIVQMVVLSHYNVASLVAATGT